MSGQGTNNRGEPPSKKSKATKTKENTALSDDGFIPLGQSKLQPVQSNPLQSTELPIWLKEKNADISLEDEVLKFYEYIKPTQAEEIIKEYVINQITEIITSVWPEATGDPGPHVMISQ